MVGAFSWLEQIYGWSKTSVIGPSHLPDDSGLVGAKMLHRKFGLE